MRVTVKLFARLRDIAGAAEIERGPSDTATVRDVWASLVADYPALAPYTSSVSVAVNAEYARMDTRISENDEVAFLPPVSGGRDCTL